jgi:hypothetical protein
LSDADELEHRADQLAGAIYGTIVVAGLLAATGADPDPDVWPTALWVFVTVVVFWLAHAWSRSIARRAAGMTARPHSFRSSLSHHWPLVQSAFPPIAVMFLAVLLGANDEDAIFLATCSCVVLLAGWGVVVGRQEHDSPGRIALTAAGCAALGAVMVVLKIAIH